MRQRLMRPTAALFPLVGIVGAVAGSGVRDFILLVFLFYYLIQLVGLCSADSFRNAAAQEPGVRRVDRRFGGTLLPLLVGIAAAFTVALLFRPANAPPEEVDYAAYLFNALLCASLSAAFIAVEHLFEERMFALGRRIDGVALSCVSNGLLLAGVLLEAGSAGRAGRWFAGATALGALISVAASYLIEPGHGFSLSPRNLPFAPRACLQTLLYPLAAGAVLFLSFTASTNALIQGNEVAMEAGTLLAAACYGLIPWRLARTTARRTADESRPLDLLLIAFAAIPAMLAPWLPGAQPPALAGALALLCAAAVFCAPDGRLCAGVALTVAALLNFKFPYLNALLALAALLLNARRALLRRR